MNASKRSIRQLIAQGDLKEAGKVALEYAEYCGAVQPANTLTVINSRLADHIATWTRGLISYEEFSRGHAKIAYDLTTILEELPDQPVPNAGKKKPLSEATFKKRLFYLMIAAKAVVLLALWHRSNFARGTGNFTKAELFATVSLLAPVFVAYVSIMIADYIRVHQEDALPVRRYVSGPLVTTAYWLLPLYALALRYIIGLKGDELTYEEMNTGLSLVETVLGGYVGQIVYAFFKKN